MPRPEHIQQEEVDCSRFLNATIGKEEVELNHEFKGKFPKTKTAVRLVFNVEGLKYPKKTNWMTFNYDKRGDLFSKYCMALVDGAKEYMNYDIAHLRGMKVKILFKATESGGKTYYNIDSIRPATTKLPFTDEDAVIEDEDTEVPF